MTREEREEAIKYIKRYRDLDEKLYTTPSRNFTIVSKDVVNKHLGYWDMAIKALEQETVTEFADRCKECGARYGKLLKQKEDILDKIRAEIEEERVHDDWDFGQEIYYNKAIDDVLQIIDKYRQEM